MPPDLAGATEPPASAIAALRAATRILAGVALRSLDILDGAVTLPQFRVLAILADLGQVRSARAAQALGLDASTITRLADRLVASGYVRRGSEPGHRGVVTLSLTPAGQGLVDQVTAWRDRELARILRRLPPFELGLVTAAFGRFVEAAGDDSGAIARGPMPW